MTSTEPITRTSSGELLARLLELRTHVPDLAGWTATGLASRPPSLVRWRQAVALSRALGLGDDLAVVLDATFVRQRPVEDYAPLIECAPRWRSAEAARVRERVRFDHPLDREEVVHAFAELFQFRLAAYRVQTWHERWLAASGLTHYAVALERGVAHAVEPAVADVDALLAAIIDPEGRSFSIEELAERFGFPNVGLAALDDEWL